MKICKFSGDPESRIPFVERLRAGDENAWSEFVESQQGRVKLIADGVVHQIEDAKDAAQEAFLAAWEGRHTLRHEENLPSWMGLIAKREAIGYIRNTRHTRNKSGVTVEYRDPVDPEFQVGGDVQDQALTSQRAEGVLKGVESKFQSGREIVARKFAGYADAEIGEAMGMTTAAVRMQVYGIRKFARTTFGVDGMGGSGAGPQLRRGR